MKRVARFGSDLARISVVHHHAGLTTLRALELVERNRGLYAQLADFMSKSGKRYRDLVRSEHQRGSPPPTAGIPRRYQVYPDPETYLERDRGLLGVPEPGVDLVAARLW
jgi:hypothetical protein